MDPANKAIDDDDFSNGVKELGKPWFHQLEMRINAFAILCECVNHYVIGD